MPLPVGIKRRLEHTHTYNLPEPITVINPLFPESSAEIVRAVVTVQDDSAATDVAFYGYPLGYRLKGLPMRRIHTGTRYLNAITALLSADALEHSGFDIFHVPTDDEEN